MVTTVPGDPEDGENDIIDGCPLALTASMKLKQNKKNLFN